MQMNPLRVSNSIHKEVYGFEQAREFNKKEYRELNRALGFNLKNSKRKTLRSFRDGRSTK